MKNSNNILKKNRILVFVHIEKAAGTTLNHILRSNFLFRHVDVRPFSGQSGKVFQPSDFRRAKKLCPWIKSMSGHSIYPAHMLREVAGLQYITLFRDPVKRYLSQFQYWRERLNYDLSFEHFLTREHSFNLQTRKIAGEVNYQKAIKILESHFFHIGIVEQFDEFLVILKQRLKPMSFNPGYRLQNIGSTSSEWLSTKKKIEAQYQNEIIARNLVDIELYKYVNEVILPRQRQDYGLGLKKDLTLFKQKLETFQWGPKRYLDYIFRKCYLDFGTGLIRKMNGLPYRGSY